MFNKLSIKLLDFVTALSDLLDLAYSGLAQHQLRTAYISCHLGKKLNLSVDEQTDLLVAALLHDIGALTPEEKINIREAEFESLDEHCLKGESVLSKISKFKSIAKIVRHHHKPYSDYQNPTTKVAKLAQIIFIADTVERKINRDQMILLQTERIINELTKLADKQFSPQLVTAFKTIADQEYFWLDLENKNLKQIICNRFIIKNETLSFDFLSDLSAMVRDLTDFRSTFTATHTTGVMEAASLLAEKVNFSDYELKMMEIAGLLHDAGKFVIPNSILTKSGKLTSKEFQQIRQHTYYTYVFLKEAGFPDDICEWASFHHEKLDGEGYPFQLSEDCLSLGARIMAVSDVFTAMAEDRPYRDGLNKEKVISIMKEMVENHKLDEELVSLLAENYQEIRIKTKTKQAEMDKRYNDLLKTAN